jgi:hypothetical protein
MKMQKNNSAIGFLRRLTYSNIQLLCIGIGILYLIGCSKQESTVLKVKNYFRPDSLNDLLIDNLRTKRIIMLGDAKHGNGYYMRLVTGLLDRWLDQLEKERTLLSSQGETQKRDQPLYPLPKKLILFIEADSERTDTIRHYLQTGNISNWLMRAIQSETKLGGLRIGISMDNIEFFRNLKRIEERIRKLNIQDASHPYDFRIIGPEGIPPYDLIMTKDSTLLRERYQQFEKARFEYFVRQRDEVSSNTIRKTLDTNPDYKALIFYSTAHLLLGRQNKARWEAPKGIDTAYGYFMAHYLDQYFSRDSVSIFFSWNYLKRPYSGIEELERSATTPDYYVYCKPIPPAQCPLEIINCQTTLRVLFELMKKYGLGNSEEEQVYALIYTNRLAFQLKRSYLNSRPDVRPWLDSLRRYAQDTSRVGNKRKVEIADKLIKGFDAIQNINSLDKWIAMPLNDGPYYLPILKRVLTNMPSIEYEQLEKLSLNEDLKSIILSCKEDLINYFLINLLWIGTHDETNRARKELILRTGLKLRTAEEWSAWWRTQYDDPLWKVY